MSRATGSDPADTSNGTETAIADPDYTVPTRPDGWPDLLGRRPLSSTERARLRAALQDAAPPARTGSDACHLTIGGLDGITDPGKAIRLRGCIHAAARSAAERRRTTFEATDSTITIGIHGPDAAERINRLQAMIGHLATKHGWTFHANPPHPASAQAEAKQPPPAALTGPDGGA
ncbi:hypothetical protein [Streptosporangium amethystogenes]|uniref:hypothetical protein n=1 Tax=Streptosporangium amethystogenes TaxID=2002 RepID=UPI0004CA6712|nr:hypothetical protein [Streptosporangium amethystogenes]